MFTSGKTTLQFVACGLLVILGLCGCEGTSHSSTAASSSASSEKAPSAFSDPAMEPAGSRDIHKIEVHDVSLQLATPGRAPGDEEVGAVCETPGVRSRVAIPSSPGRIVVTSVQVSDGYTTVPQNGQSQPCNPLSTPCPGLFTGWNGRRPLFRRPLQCLPSYWDPSQLPRHGVLRARFKITCPMAGWCEERGVGALSTSWEFGV
jgi:hypothetical protein